MRGERDKRGERKWRVRAGRGSGEYERGEEVEKKRGERNEE